MRCRLFGHVEREDHRIDAVGRGGDRVAIGGVAGGGLKSGVVDADRVRAPAQATHPGLGRDARLHDGQPDTAARADDG